MSSPLPSLTIDADAVHWTLDGATASRGEAAAALAAGRPLLLGLHGFGAHERDLVPTATLLPPRYVGAFLRAPLPVYGGMGGYAWFPLMLDDLLNVSPEARQTARAAAEAVWEWLHAMLNAAERLAPGDSASTPETPEQRVARYRTVVLGFSQGGAIATSLMRLYPDAFIAGVNLSGFIVPGDLPGDDRLAERRPPLFWGRDEADPVVPPEAAATVANWAPQHTELTARSYAGTGHGISVEELRDVAEFLNREG